MDVVFVYTLIHIRKSIEIVKEIGEKTSFTSVTVFSDVVYKVCVMNSFENFLTNFQNRIDSND